MQPQALAHIERLTRHLRGHGAGLVIDADTHATDPDRRPRSRSPHYFHGKPLSAEELVAEMDLAGVSMANTWQNPAATPYPGREDGNAEALLEANRYVFQCAQRFPERFIPSGWVDPKACGTANACRLAEICVREFGFLLVKMNPAQNRFPIDSPEVTAVADRIVELGAVPVFHFGADSPYTPASGLEAIAARYPGHPVIGVHMGGGGAGYVEAERLYHESRELGLRRPNVRFILSALRDTHIEEALVCYQSAGPPYCENLFCASDAPYGRMSWNFGGFRAMFAGLRDGGRHPDPRLRANPGLFNETAVEGYLGGNFARMILEQYGRMLKVQQAQAV